MALTRNELKLLIKEELNRVDIDMLQNPSKSQDESDLYEAIKEASRALESIVGTSIPEYNGIADQLAAASQNLRDALDTLSVRNPVHQADSSQFTTYDSEEISMHGFHENKSE